MIPASPSRIKDKLIATGLQPAFGKISMVWDWLFFALPHCSGHFLIAPRFFVVMP
jgi:hypothetical protein